MFFSSFVISATIDLCTLAPAVSGSGSARTRRLGVSALKMANRRKIWSVCLAEG